MNNKISDAKLSSSSLIPESKMKNWRIHSDDEDDNEDDEDIDESKFNIDHGSGFDLF